MPEHEVIIVGAGPTGLAMAIELKRQGIPFRLIDKSMKPAQCSQALGVQARSLEQFERYNIADNAIQRGRPLKHGAMISEGKTVVSFAFDKIPGHYPFLLFLPQSETETLLIEHLERLGAKIERGIEMVGIAEKTDGVELQLRNAAGQMQTSSANWVIGCDGAHSAVRDAVQIPFSGAAVGLNFFLGDLQLEGPDLPGDELRVYLHRGDIVFIGRLKENVFRLIIAKHSEQNATGSKQQLTISDFQEPIDAAGIRLRVVSAEWMTPFRVNDRRAEHVRHNRVFLAGDASHIHSPVAGQGMNTGMQDAANLGWKLAAVLNGANSTLLDSYEEERGKVSEQLLRNTSRVLHAATSTSPLVEKVRDAVASLASRIPYVQEQVLGFISETAIAYRDSSIVVDAGGSSSLRAGDRMPNLNLRCKGARMRLLDGLKTGRHLLLGLNVAEQERIRAIVPRAEFLFLDISDITEGRVPLAETLGASGDLLLVRPDGYIGFRGTVAQLDRLASYSRNVGLQQRASSTVA